jgi:hypothetical protein
MKSIVLTSLFLLVSFSNMAQDAWQRPDCSGYKNQDACILDVVLANRAKIRKEFQALGLTYHYYASADFSDLSDEQQKVMDELQENKEEGIIDFSYDIAKDGTTTNIKVANISNDKLAFYVPFFVKALEESSFVAPGKTIKAPVFRAHFLYNSEADKDEKSK